MADNPSSSDVHPVDAIVEEIVERLRRGERPTVAEYLARHADLAEELRAVLPALLAVEQLKPAGNDPTGPYSSSSHECKRLERIGDYRILRQVGRGGMGIVYEAEQVSLGRHVALKVLPAQSLLEAQRFQRFEREARAAARLHHTNIVPIYGVGSDQGHHYYVMQFIHGHPLNEVLAELCHLRSNQQADAESPASQVASQLLSGSFQGAAAVSGPEIDPVFATPAPGSSGLSKAGHGYWISVARLGMQVAEALAYAHSQGVLHRDIKPSNLLLDLHGVVWVTDFGLAKASDSDDLTQTGDIVGTVRYMAPERFNGHADGRSDVYALGLTLYEFLTLRPAFDGSDRQKLVRQVMEEEPVAPRKVAPAIPRDLETIVLKAIARDPAQRYAKALDFAEDLQRFIDDQPIQARRITQVERFWRWCRRNPVLAGLGAGLLLALLVVTGLALRSARDQSDLARSREGQVQIAEEGRRESERQMARQHIDRATRLIEQGNLAEATLWSLAALRADPNDPDRAEQHRLRLGLLLRQCPRPTHVFFHRARVGDAVFSPDGRLLATACDDGLVHLRDWVTGKDVCSPLVHDHPVMLVQFSPDGLRLLTVAGAPVASGNRERRGDRDTVSKRDVRVWEVKTGRPLTGVLPHVEEPRKARFYAAGQQVLTCTPDKTWQVWDAGNGQPTALKLSAAQVNGRSTALRLDGEQLLLHPTPVPPMLLGLSVRARNNEQAQLEGLRPEKAESADIQLWDLRTNELRTLASSAACYSGGITFSPDGKRIVLVYSDKAHVHDTASGKRLASYVPTEGRIIRVEFSPDGLSVLSYLFLGEEVHSIARTQVWDAVTGQALSPLVATATVGPAPEFASDSRRILMHDSSKAVVLVDARSGQTLTRVPGAAHAAPGQAISPDGRYLASTDQDGVVRIHETNSSQPISPWLHNQGGIGHRESAARPMLEFTPDGSHLLTSGGSTVRIWPVLGAAAPGVTISTQSLVEHAFLSPDGKRVTLVADGVCQTWSGDDGKTLHPPFPVGGQIFDGTFTRDGRFLFLNIQKHLENFEMHQASLFLDTHSGRHMRLEPTEPSPDFKARFLNSSGFRSAGQYLLTALSNPGFPPDNAGKEELRIWDSATGKQVGPALSLPGLRTACWSPDGNTVLTTVAEEKKLRTSLWTFDPARGLEPLREFDPVALNFQGGHETNMILWQVKARFDEDGGRVLLAAPSSRKTIDLRVWETAGEKQLAKLTRIEVENLESPYSSIEFGANGRSVLIVAPGRNEVSVQVGHLETGRLLHLAPPAGQSGFVRKSFDLAGERILLANDQSTNLYDAESGALLIPPLPNGGFASFSLDGRRILIASPNAEACYIHDAATGLPLIPPLRNVAAWNNAGGRLVVRESSDRVRIHDLSPDSRSVEDLTRLVEATTGQHFNSAGILQPLALEQFESAWNDVRARYGSDWDQTLVIGSPWHQQALANMSIGRGLDPSWSSHPRSEGFAVSWHLSQQIARQPSNAELFKQRAEAYGWLRQWDRALADLKHAMKLGMQGDASPLRLRCSEALAELGRWNESVVDLEQALSGMTPVEKKRQDASFALLYLKTGDVPAYEKACKRMLDEFEHPTPSRYLPTVPWPTLLRRESSFDWERLAKAPPSRVSSTRDYMGEQTLLEAGLLLRRARNAEVVQLLDPVVARPSPSTAVHCFVLSMALKQLPGQEPRAKEVLALGIARMRDSHDPAVEADDQSITPRWKRRLAEEFFKAQAEEIVHGKK